MELLPGCLRLAVTVYVCVYLYVCVIPSLSTILYFDFTSTSKLLVVFLVLEHVDSLIVVLKCASLIISSCVSLKMGTTLNEGVIWKFITSNGCLNATG